jgi:hypothetical protein
MSSLTGNLISSTYQSILKIGTNNTASANLNNVTDGVGNATGLFVSTAETAVSGSFTVTGSMTVSGTLAATSSNAISASYAVSSSLAVSASNANFLDGLDSTAFVLKSGSNVMTGSIILDGQLSFNNGQGTLVLPANTAPIPTVGSTYYNGSTLYVYNGSQYIQIGGDTVISASFAVSASRATSAANATTASFATTALTASYVLNAVSASQAATASYVATASHAVTSSYALDSNLLDGKDSTIFATTGSNTFTGNQAFQGFVTSDFVPVTGSTYDLGSVHNPWREIYVSTGSLKFVLGGAVISTLSVQGGNEISLGDSLSTDVNGVNMSYLVPDGPPIVGWQVGNPLVTLRRGLAGAGTRNSMIAAGGRADGGNQAPVLSCTEAFNGTVWNSQASLNTARTWLGAAGTSNNSTLVFGGQACIFNGPQSNYCYSKCTELFNGTTWTTVSALPESIVAPVGFGTSNAAISAGGQYGTGSVQVNFNKAFLYDGTAWSSQEDLLYPTVGGGAAGTQNDGLVFGGYSYGSLTCTQAYNGTTWTAGGALNTSRDFTGGAGASSTSAVAFGGLNGFTYADLTGTTEEYNGTVWTSGNAMIIPVAEMGSGGAQQSAVSAGGAGSAYTGTNCVQIYESYQPYTSCTTFQYSNTTGNVEINGTVSIDNVLTLQPQNPLPNAAANPYSFAVSSSKPYFSDGTTWTPLF